MTPTIAISRDISAPAEKIFSILSRPAAHPTVDGSGMVRSTLDDIVVSKVGDVFAMNMVHHEFGEYVMENHVRELEADRRIVWEPMRRPDDGHELADEEKGFYLWGWELEPLGESSTRVTEFFDCSRSSADLRNAVKEGEGWRLAIEQSLENLEKVVTAG